MIRTYARHPAQFRHGDRVVVSTFAASNAASTRALNEASYVCPIADFSKTLSFLEPPARPEHYNFTTLTGYAYVR